MQLLINIYGRHAFITHLQRFTGWGGVRHIPALNFLKVLAVKTSYSQIYSIYGLFMRSYSLLACLTAYLIETGLIKNTQKQKGV